MIPYAEQLTAIVAAVTFVSPERARVTSLRGAQREVAVASEREPSAGSRRRFTWTATACCRLIRRRRT